MNLQEQRLKVIEQQIIECRTKNFKLRQVRGNELEKCISEKGELYKQVNYLNNDMSDISIKLLHLERSSKDYDRRSVQKDAEIESLKVLKSELQKSLEAAMTLLSEITNKNSTCRSEMSKLGLKIQKMNEIISVRRYGGDRPFGKPEPSFFGKHEVDVPSVFDDDYSGPIPPPYVPPEPEGESGYNCVKRWNVRGSSKYDKLKSCEKVVSNEPIDDITRFRGRQPCITACNEDQ